jgi:hypothetical protein
MVAAPVTAAPALQSSKNTLPNIQPDAMLPTSLSPSLVKYEVWQAVRPKVIIEIIIILFIFFLDILDFYFLRF